MFSKFSFPKALLISLSFFISHAANAELTQVSVLIEEGKTDCSGKNAYFDDPNTEDNSFSDCKIFVENDNGTLSYLSDVIIKLDVDNDKNFFVDTDGISRNYTDKIEQADFTTIEFDDENQNTSGKWIYNKGNYTYPDIRFWTAKAGSDFLLFWQVELDDVSGNCLNSTDGFNLSYNCMSLAQSVTEGTWSTPNTKSLSHITFFGGLCLESDANDDINCGTTTTQVPEPTSIALFGLALLGITARRKKSV